MANQPLVIDTPEGIAHYRMAAIISALRFEVRAGMQMSRLSALKGARSYGITARTKKAALVELEVLYEETYGRPFGA